MHAHGPADSGLELKRLVGGVLDLAALDRDLAAKRDELDALVGGHQDSMHGAVAVEVHHGRAREVVNEDYFVPAARDAERPPLLAVVEVSAGRARPGEGSFDVGPRVIGDEVGVGGNV